MAPSTTAAPPLDFAALISRNKNLKPAAVTQIIQNDVHVKREQPKNQKASSTSTGPKNSNGTNRGNGNHSGNGTTDMNSNMMNGNKLKKKPMRNHEPVVMMGMGSSSGSGTVPDLIHSMDYAMDQALTMTEAEVEDVEKATDLAYRLSIRTSAGKKAAIIPASLSSTMNIDKDGNLDVKIDDDTLVQFMDTRSLEERMRLEKLRKKNEDSLPCALHQVQLGDWESNINWDGVVDQEQKTVSKGETNGNGNNNTTADAIQNANTNAHNSSERAGSKDISMSEVNVNTYLNNKLSQSSALPDPMAILSETYNPSLEAIDLDNLISWDGADASPGFNDRLARKMGKLILQDGVAGLSVATKSIAVATAHPIPFIQSDVYKRRMELKQNKAGSSSAQVGSLQKDHAALEKEIKARQEKRAQMAIDKTNRVKGALGKLDLGGGTGRAITSSLMGPGGTERTGRPSRQNMSSHAHDATYVEQLDMVNNHILVKADLSFGELRHYHRPTMQRKMFKPAEVMPWQFQVRAVPNSKNSKRKKGVVGPDGSLISNSSYQNLNANPGALSQSKIRNGADLSPTEGMLVVMEYSEQKPPIQMTKGMAAKMINYYRGDRSKCPVSAGGGDRPLRKKKHSHSHQDEDRNVSRGSTGKVEKPPRLARIESDKVTDLIGKIPTKKKNDESQGLKEPKLTVLPEGRTEILHAKDHGPFIGAIKEGVTQSSFISSLFAAPIFRHDPRKTDFLLILGKVPNRQQTGGALKLPVVIRPMPDNIFCVGQTEPKTKVHPPESSGERAFFQTFSVFQIAKALQRKHHGLRFEDIKDGLFPNTGVLNTQLRLRIKKVAIYDKNTQIWTLKDIGFEEFPGVEALGRDVSPEGVAANWESRAATLRLQDLGINYIYRMANGTTNLAAAMTYLNGQIHAAKKRLRMLGKLVKSQKKSKDRGAFVQAEAKLEAAYKALKRKGEVANFIFEALQLAPWQLTTDFIDVHKRGQGSGMMKLTGLGDPSGVGAAFNFIRELDGKSNKSSPNGDGALNARVKKITGTDKDLRKLNMKQMADILRSYGLPQKDIDKLKRWDRVHCIRDLSTKAASDNMADGLEKFARGEKMKLSDQKKIYSERIQEIWERQRFALTEDPGDHELGRAGEEVMDEAEGKKAEDAIKEEESDDDDDDDFFNDMEDIFRDTEKTNELVSNELRGEEEASGAFRALKKDGSTQEMNNDARDLLNFQRLREEERANRKDLDKVSGEEAQYTGHYVGKARKVIRRKTTKTNPDGSQTITFKFIVQSSEIKKALSEKKPGDNQKTSKSKKKKGFKSEIILHEGSKNPVGHAMFEEEDEGGKVHVQVKRRGRGGRTRKTSDEDFTTSRSRKTPGAKSRSKSADKRSKRKRSEDEELDYYVTNARRKGTSNRKERGAARERMPHVMFSQRLEEIRLGCEKRPASGPFHRPVDKRCNVYYEKIKRPMDLQTIRDKIQKYEYRSVHAFVNDFELMKQNAVTFNGLGSTLGNEATAISDFVKATVEENRADFDLLEVAVDEQMNSNKKRGSRASTPKLPSKVQAGKTANVTIDGITTEVNLGNIQSSFLSNDSDSD